MRGLPRRRRALAVLVLGAGVACGSPGSKVEPPEAGAAAPSRAPGRLEYEQAKDAVLAGNHRRAVELLASATREDAQVCEYWYQLGAAEANLAIEVVYDSDAEAVRLFEASVDHKREAMRLMNEGKCPIWTEQQREQARFDGEMGLRDADEVLRDRASLVMGLRLMADQRAR